MIAVIHVNIYKNTGWKFWFLQSVQFIFNSYTVYTKRRHVPVLN